MKTYSPLFETLYDETTYSPQCIGRGVHYSILRAKLPSGSGFEYWDFAVIWDEDHDERIIGVLEKLYEDDLLKNYIIVGERKGCFTAILAPGVALQEFNKVPCNYTDAEGDEWSFETLTFDQRGNGLIAHDSEERIKTYLSPILEQYQLGQMKAEREINISKMVLALAIESARQRRKLNQSVQDVCEAREDLRHLATQSQAASSSNAHALSAVGAFQNQPNRSPSLEEEDENEESVATQRQSP